MILKKEKIYNIWIVILLIYLYIKMLSSLNINLISPIYQELYLYIMTIVEVFMIFKFSDGKVDRVILYSLLFCLFGGMSTFFNGNSRDILHDMIYINFWFVTFFNLKICNINKFFLKKMIKYLTVSNFLMIVSFLFSYIYHLDTKDFSSLSNSIYFILCLFPLIFFENNKFTRVFLFLGTIMCVLLSGKRTAVLGIIMMFLIPFVLKIIKDKDRHLLQNILLFSMTIILVIYIYNYLIKYFDIAVLDRFKNMFSDGGSGRIDIYTNVLNSFSNSNLINKLMGNGYNSVYNLGISFTSAHNDFIEVLFDFGLFGLLFYLLFLYEIIRYAIKLYKFNCKSYMVYISTIVLFLIMSTTSHLIIYPTYIIYLLIFLILSKAYYDVGKIKH